jgi:hypothetical protein
MVQKENGQYVLDEYGNKIIDRHIGIVVAYDPRTTQVYTIEGNYGNEVSYVEVKSNDPTIKGYGINGGTGYGTIPSDFAHKGGSTY